MAVLGSLAAIAGGVSAASAASPSPPLIAGKPVCGATKTHVVRCNSRLLTDGSGQVVRSSTPAGYGPVQLQSAYGLTAASARATSAVVAIVDAYHDPTAKSDLDVYSSTFGLPVMPACSGTSNAGCFRQVNQFGGSTPPPANGSWALEISLDVQTVHAICPGCGILLVEANSNYDSDLYTAEDYAVTHSSVVSNSWGGREYSGEKTDDTHFDHPGVAITVSSGDNGYGGGVQYPAASQYVTAVGGTTLTLNGDDTRRSETAWNGAGSGCSFYEPKPSWQTDSGCSRRTITDVSADSDPNTGAAVYDTVTPYKGWFVVGGTSLASPLVAGIYALNGIGGESTYPSSYPYAETGSLFDVTSGSNGACPIGASHYLCAAGPGYDGPTGLGTPVGTAAFAGAGGGGGSAPTVTSFSPTSGPEGTEVDIQGTNFTGATSVTFNSTPDPGFVLDSSTEITAHVPTGATTGPVAVTTPDGTGTSSSLFTVTGGGSGPTVTSFSPTSGPVGADVTIQGANFTGATQVAFNGTPAGSFTVAGDTSIQATVPAGATTGTISVTSPDGTGTSSSAFTVTTTSPKRPSVEAFHPSYGYPGTIVTITGANFLGVTSVRLGLTQCGFMVMSPTTIVAVVPDTYRSLRRWAVTNSGGTGTSRSFFRIL